MNNTPLFRSAAADACRVSWLGQIVLIRPPSFTILTFLSASIGLLVIGFLIFGTYTKRNTVSGMLVTNAGLIKIYSVQPGIVQKKYVNEGQSVKRGDVLYTLATDRQNLKNGEVQALISQQVNLRKQSLRTELNDLQKIQKEETIVLQKKIEGLQAEKINIDEQLYSQNMRVELSEAALKRYQKLQMQGYISAEMLQQKEADSLDQRTRRQVLEREKIKADIELHEMLGQLNNLSLTQRTRTAQIERLIATTEQERTEIESKRYTAVTAPEGGSVTAILADQGQTVDSSRPMLSIIPDGAVLQANLYAPSRAIGFIRRSDKVMLRYQAFPYQKFGHAEGTIASISRTTLSNNEILSIPGLATNTTEPLYRITVTLPSQAITAYGKQQNLQSGMLVDAEIFLEKRKIYEWILEPLYTITGKI